MTAAGGEGAWRVVGYEREERKVLPMWLGLDMIIGDIPRGERTFAFLYRKIARCYDITCVPYSGVKTSELEVMPRISLLFLEQQVNVFIAIIIFTLNLAQS